MTRRLLNALTATVLVIVVAGCGREVTPVAVATPASISITQLSSPNRGFTGAGPALLAAPSLIDVLGLVHGLGAYPRFDDCAQYAYFRASCWLDVNDPGNSLMVAAVIHEPCTSTQSITASLSAPQELTVTVVSSPACTNGGAMAPRAVLSLLAIPLTQLPPAEITVRLVHTGISVPTAKTMVDLRLPLNIGTDIKARMNEVDAATTAALMDAQNRVAARHTASFLGFGTDRWSDTSLGCPTPGRSYSVADARGYVVFMKDSDPLQLPLEYHVSGATLAYCGRSPY